MSARNGLKRARECEQKDLPARHRKSTASRIKGRYGLWEQSGKRVSLKQFARELAASAKDDAQVAGDWLFNKRAHTKSPTLWLGSTRKRKGDNNKSKATTPAKGK